jgi:hypothetical protein
LRQASRRSWRIGQRQPVKVYFLAYQETLQEKGLRLIAAKVRSALAVEGELLDDGLSAFHQDQDFFLQLARAIVEPESAQESAFEDGIAHPSRTERELDRYLSDEEPFAEEEPVTAHGNGKLIPPPEPELIRMRDVQPVPEIKRQAPLFTRLESPEQLVLF